MCGCSQNKVVLNEPSPNRVIPTDITCTVTLAQIHEKKLELIAMKKPENFGYINARLGELQTMENTGKYCQYPL